MGICKAINLIVIPVMVIYVMIIPIIIDVLIIHIIIAGMFQMNLFSSVLKLINNRLRSQHMHVRLSLWINYNPYFIHKHAFRRKHPETHIIYIYMNNFIHCPAICFYKLYVF